MLGFHLRLVWLGGTTILDRIEEADYDVFRRRPALSRRDRLSLAIRALGGLPSPGPRSHAA